MAFKDAETKRIYDRAYYAKHRDKISTRKRESFQTPEQKEHRRKYGVAWRKANTSLFRQIVKRWENKHPERIHAIWSVNDAVRSGKMKRPNQCECCDNTGRIEGHHFDYAKPLDVVWLCRSCHGWIHSGAL